MEVGKAIPVLPLLESEVDIDFILYPSIVITEEFSLKLDKEMFVGAGGISNEVNPSRLIID